jgi:hypothetical protein
MHIAKPYDDRVSVLGIIAGAFYGGTFYWGMDQVNVQRVLERGIWCRRRSHVALLLAQRYLCSRYPA